MAPLVERIALGGLGADPGLIVISVAADVDADPRFPDAAVDGCPRGPISVIRVRATGGSRLR